MNEVLKTIRNRRSVREYKSEQIIREHLDQIIEAGILAPSAMNEQPWHFTVIQNPELLRRINDTVKEKMAASDNEWVRKNASDSGFTVTYNAPALIIVSGDQNGVAWQADCSFAMENMMLAAESLGIGSVCLGMVKIFLEIPGEAEKLGVPEGYKPFLGIAFGYKVSDKEIEPPKRNLDVVNYIS